MPYGAIIAGATENVSSPALSTVQFIDAWDRKHDAKKALKNLKKWNPKFRSVTDLQSEANTQVQFGYSPQQTATFMASLSRANNAARRIGRDANPNLAGAVNSVVNYQNLGALNEFASSDAALLQQKRDKYFDAATNQWNSQTIADIASKREQEMAYGAAVNQARSQMYSAAYGMMGQGANAKNMATAQYPQAAPTTYQMPTNQGTVTPALQEQQAPQIAIEQYQSPYAGNAYNPYGRIAAPQQTTVTPAATQMAATPPQMFNPYNGYNANPYLISQ